MSGQTYGLIAQNDVTKLALNRASSGTEFLFLRYFTATGQSELSRRSILVSWLMVLAMAMWKIHVAHLNGSGVGLALSLSPRFCRPS